MQTKVIRALALGILPLAFLIGVPAHADHLQVPANAPLWMHIGAAIILYSHIGGGTVGLLAGTVAIVARKGGTIHRAAGNVFFVAMLVMSGIGAVIAPILPDRISTLAGFMTFYLIFTGWMTGRRREGVSGWERFGLFYALTGAAAAIYLSWLASQTPEGTLDGAPRPAFYIFLTVSTIAALGDLKLILQGGISGVARIARHVWRMTFGLFVASGSLFLGQMQVFPLWLRHTPVLFIAALAPLVLMLFWMIFIRFAKRYRNRPASLAMSPA